ncbi:hypothetical protein GCM10012275_42960 [Longimycelium tulufanense]|uniref:Uncharacterized protein n=2 Tax=Longimycelium tulufanense TaxID=907463 RepID=A0A8J3CHK9_9PSEU|nr:hypothetical protein GCM10012275_42960 [Longimycelium tulufanense]
MGIGQDQDGAATPTTTSHTGRRRRRAPKVVRQLERARERNARQLAEQRQREQRVEQALGAFIAAGEQIEAVEQRLQEKVREHETKVSRLREAAEQKVSGARVARARAALAIHEAGRTVEQVADLLEVSQREARRLIAVGRQAPGEALTPVPPTGQRGSAPPPRTATATPPRGPAGTGGPSPTPPENTAGTSRHQGEAGTPSPPHRSGPRPVPATDADGDTGGSTVGGA